MKIRVSEAGGCPRRLQLQYQGIEGFPLWEGTLRAFEEGVIHETSILNWAKDNLPGAPFKLRDQQREVHIGDLLEGHIDGILENEKEQFLVEAKALSRRGFQELREKGVREAHPQYYVQIQLYLYALEFEKAFLVARNKETPKSQLWEMYYEKVPLDKEFAENEIARLTDVAQKIEQGIEIPPPYDPEVDWNCRLPWCLYSQVCWPDYRKKIQTVENADELEEVVRSYIELSNQIRELEQEKDGLKEILLSSISGSAKVGRWLVEVSERRSERFDTSLAKRELPPDLLNRFLKVSTYKILSVKEE